MHGCTVCMCNKFMGTPEDVFVGSMGASLLLNGQECLELQPNSVGKHTTALDKIWSAWNSHIVVHSCTGNSNGCSNGS